MKYDLKENQFTKTLRSENYNYNFDKDSGFFMRWGKTPSEDPDWCEFGPEIADIEISTVCNGINNVPCKFCYKSNNGNGKNMSLSTFIKLFKKLPNTVCQIAFGIGDIHANPDMYSIMQHCRNNGVIPNVTINGWNMSGLDYHMLAKTCGAVAVSRYDPKDVCYSAVQGLSQKGLQQVNIHQLLCKDTYKDCLEVMRDVKTDQRLSGLNSIVFLALKQCGRGKSLEPVSLEEYSRIVEYALTHNIRIGFDSCSAPMFLRTITDLMVNAPELMSPEKYKLFTAMVEPCESLKFSVYIDVEGRAFPCSFCENKFNGVDILSCNDFLNDFWNCEKSTLWRNKLQNTSTGGLVEGCRECFEYRVWRNE